MNAMDEVQERVRRFNEDEAVWSRFASKRAIRRLIGSPLDLPEDVIDEIDWREAENEIRWLEAVGKWVE